MKTFLTILLSLFMYTASATQVLWAALSESSVIDNIAFRTYTDLTGNFVNAARLSVSDAGISQSEYSMDAVTQLALWIPYWGGEPQEYWEEDFPVTCLHDEDGDYYMGKWSSQFNLGDKPNPNATIFFELGYVADWDDFDSPFITLATATTTVQELIDGNFIYPSGTIYPPTQENWMPTQFHAVPEPSVSLLALLGIGMLLKRRK